MKKNKTAAVSGYYGFGNIGDEAVLFSILHNLKEIDSEIKPVVFSNDPEATRLKYKVESVNRWSMISVACVLFRSKILISGGGSLLQDVTGVKNLIYYLGVVVLAKVLNNKVIYYAQGIGPLKTTVGKMLVKHVTNRVDYVTVRDEFSKKILEEIGVKKPPIEITADPVLGLNKNHIDLREGRKVLDEYGLPSNASLIGISVREWKEFYGYKKAFAKTADELIDKGWKVVFVPFHLPQDLTACRDVINYMKNEAVLLNKHMSAEKLLSLIGNFDLLIGMRLHSLIMSSVMGVPMIGVSYDPKVDNFLNLIGQTSAGSVENLCVTELKERIFWALDNKEELKSQLHKKTVQLEAAAKKTPYLVSKYFNY